MSPGTPPLVLRGEIDSLTLKPGTSSPAHLAVYPTPNPHLCNTVGELMSASAGATDGVEEARTELDSHTNMCVIGKHSLVIQYSGRHADVSAFSPSVESLHKVPIVDAAIAYDCPYSSSKTYILVVRNALYVPSMHNNLIPPFVMREAGVEVSEVPKIHVHDPTVEDHSIYFKDQDLRIPLSLWGIFSYFPSRKPCEQDQLDDNILFITPDGPEWNPHSDSYARNEESFLDWRGMIIEPKVRQRLIIDEFNVDAFEASLEVGTSEYCSEENKLIDDVCEKATVMMTDAVLPDWDNRIEDEVTLSLSHVNETLDPLKFARDLSGKVVDSKFGMSIGSMHGVLMTTMIFLCLKYLQPMRSRPRVYLRSSFQNFGRLILNLLSER